MSLISLEVHKDFLKLLPLDMEVSVSVTREDFLLFPTILDSVFDNSKYTIHLKGIKDWTVIENQLYLRGTVENIIDVLDNNLTLTFSPCHKKNQSL